MKNFLATTSIAFALAMLIACGGAGTNNNGGAGTNSNGGGSTAKTSSGKLDLKVGSKDSSWEIKSTAVYPSEMVFTAPGKPNVKTSLHTIYLANYDLGDTTAPGWMNKPLTAPDQTRVEIQLTGDDGSDMKAPFKVGTYAAQAKQTSGVRLVKIVSFADGKQTETRFDNLMGYGSGNATGEAKITNVAADTVSGEVNLTEGEKSVKGNFTAKLPAAKK